MPLSNTPADMQSNSRTYLILNFDMRRSATLIGMIAYHLEPLRYGAAVFGVIHFVFKPRT